MGETVINTPTIKRRYPSVLVCDIGDCPMPGQREALVAAIEYYRQTVKGQCDLLVMPGLMVFPPLGLGCMRNFGVEYFLLGGHDYLLLVDHDVVLEPDTIARVVSRSKGYIVPYFDQTPFTNLPTIIADPMFAAGQGVALMNWVTPWCNLISREALLLVGPRPFTESMIYREDEFNSLFFRVKGVSIWQDTDAPVKLLKGAKMLHEHLANPRICVPFEKPGQSPPERTLATLADVERIVREIMKENAPSPN